MASDVVCHVRADTDELVAALEEMKQLKEAGASLPEWIDGAWLSGSLDDVLEMIQGPSGKDGEKFISTIVIRPTDKFRKSLEEMRRQVNE